MEMNNFQVLCFVFLASTTILPYADAIFKAQEVIKILKKLELEEKSKSPKSKKNMQPRPGGSDLYKKDEDWNYRKPYMPKEHKLHLSPGLKDKLLWVDPNDDYF